ncbi:hypothetical protein, partial [Salmonella sp. s55044]|uniref:hypothetical protein n=1 Tax=Salmonella sp. s55044 TaxID=3159677 RepID=UPI00397FE39A
MSEWLTTFLAIVKEETGFTFNKNDVTKFTTYFSVNNLRDFTKNCRSKLRSSIKQLDLLSELSACTANDYLTKRWLLRLPKHVHIERFNAIGGCSEQCPFCGVVCDHP